MRLDHPSSEHDVIFQDAPVVHQDRACTVLKARFCFLQQDNLPTKQLIYLHVKSTDEPCSRRRHPE